MLRDLAGRLEQLRENRADDAGTTLMELVVGMAILAIFLGIFSGALYLMGSTVSKVGAVSDAVSQTNKAFLALDKTVRYASGISQPTQSSSSGDWHVEFDTAKTVNGLASATTTDECTQLRVHSNQLQQRAWTVSGTTYKSGSLTGWLPLASNITNVDASGTAFAPFIAVTSSGAASPYQQLTIKLKATSGTSTTASNTSSMTFAAVNSSAASTASVCQQVAVDATS